MAVAVMFILMVSWLVLPSPDKRTENALFAALFGVFTFPSLLVATTAIIVRRDAGIILVNMWTIVTIPLSEVASLSAENGFEVVLKSGRRESSSAIANSLIGTIAKYPSARRAIRRVEQFLGRDLSTPQNWQPGGADVTRRLRLRAMSGCLAYALFVGVVAYFLSG
jgi:hypothetical protein